MCPPSPCSATCAEQKVIYLGPVTAERTAAVTPGVCALQDVQVAQLQAHLNEQLFPSDSIMTTYQVRNIPLLSVVPPAISLSIQSSLL